MPSGAIQGPDSTGGSGSPLAVICLTTRCAGIPLGRSWTTIPAAPCIPSGGGKQKPAGREKNGLKNSALLKTYFLEIYRPPLRQPSPCRGLMAHAMPRKYLYRKFPCDCIQVIRHNPNGGCQAAGAEPPRALWLISNDFYSAKNSWKKNNPGLAVSPGRKSRRSHSSGGDPGPES